MRDPYQDPCPIHPVVPNEDRRERLSRSDVVDLKRRHLGDVRFLLLKRRDEERIRPLAAVVLMGEVDLRVKGSFSQLSR
jgi:hypothetical protein